MTFTEGGESAGCAGGEVYEGEGKARKGVLRFAPGASAPIVKSAGKWVIGSGAGGIGGGSVQPAEVPLRLPGGLSGAGSISATLTGAKKGPLSGGLTWREGECAVAFVVKPG
jgi:hypothetical protein